MVFKSNIKTKTKTLISEFENKPLEIGDKVYIRGLGIQNKQNFGGIVIVEDIDMDGNIIHSDNIKCLKKDYKKYTNDVGYNPFPDKEWDSEIHFYNYTLSNILSINGFNCRDGKFTNEIIKDVEIPELCWTPIVIVDNKEVGYQRDFCWELKDKQLLIDSIYKGIDIGKIIVRKRSWEYIEERIDHGQIENTAFKDIIDGKQRLNCLIEFIQGSFKDSNGMFFEDLSLNAKRKFVGSNKVSYGELEENSSDEQVLETFLNVNTSGVKMDETHMETIKKIKL